jgi:hypothetical protein
MGNGPRCIPTPNAYWLSGTSTPREVRVERFKGCPLPHTRVGSVERSRQIEILAKPGAQRFARAVLAFSASNFAVRFASKEEGGSCGEGCDSGFDDQDQRVRLKGVYVELAYREIGATVDANFFVTENLQATSTLCDD